MENIVNKSAESDKIKTRETKVFVVNESEFIVADDIMEAIAVFSASYMGPVKSIKVMVESAVIRRD